MPETTRRNPGGRLARGTRSASYTSRLGRLSFANSTTILQGGYELDGQKSDSWQYSILGAHEAFAIEIVNRVFCVSSAFKLDKTEPCGGGLS